VIHSVHAVVISATLCRQMVMMKSLLVALSVFFSSLSQVLCVVQVGRRYWRGNTPTTVVRWITQSPATAVVPHGNSWPNRRRLLLNLITTDIERSLLGSISTRLDIYLFFYTCFDLPRRDSSLFHHRLTSLGSSSGDVLSLLCFCFPKSQQLLFLKSYPP